jgi:phosphoribosylformimino-5-aminoimidazole carboxamide ribotide isomerase
MALDHWPWVQVAGGLRDAASIATALDTGAARVVLGTAAIEDTRIVRDAADRHGPDRIALALDVRDGAAVGRGWSGNAPRRPFREVLADYANDGPATVIVTSIVRDGLLEGPDLELLEACVAATAARVIASGGVRSIDDLRAVRAVGCAGAIVGRAVYDGGIDLGDAIRALEAEPA